MDRNNKEDRAPQHATDRPKASKLNSRYNPFSDSNHLPSTPLQSSNAHPQNPEASVASSSRTSNSRSIIMARGAFSKGLNVFKEKELTQGNQSWSNADLSEHPIPSKDKDERGSLDENYQMVKSSPSLTRSQDAAAFAPWLYGITRNQLPDSHSRGLSAYTNDMDSFGMESTYDDGLHTAKENRSSAIQRSYDHDQNPTLIAKGSGDNAAPVFEASSTLSFTNTVPHGGKAFSENLDQLGALTSPKGTSSNKCKDKKSKRSKFSPNSTAVSAVSEDELYSGLSDMHMGLFLSTYNGKRATPSPPKVAKSTSFPTELPPRPTPRPPLPIRVTAEARAQFAARKQDERLALERRLAEPHLVRRSLPHNNKGSTGFFSNLKSNCWVAVGVAQFGILSTAVCVGVIIAIKNTNDKPGPFNISVPVIWWLVLSVLLLCVGASTFVVMLIRGVAHNPKVGFRRPNGSRDIADSNLRRRGDLESGIPGPQSFEMAPIAHTPRQGAFPSFATPQTVQNSYTEVMRPNADTFRQVPNTNHGFEQVPLYGARGGPNYQSPGMINEHVENYNYTPAVAESPLTPLPQAILSPGFSRQADYFSAIHHTPSKPSGSRPVNIPTPGAPFTPTGMSARTSVRSRDSLVAAATHRDLAMRTLMGESPAPETSLDITDIWNGYRSTLESPAPSQTTMYSYMPSPHPLQHTTNNLQYQGAGTFVPMSTIPSNVSSRIDLDMAIPPTLKRVETEGPLEKLEKSLSHQSAQIALGQQLPPPPDLGERPRRICHKRIVDGKLKQYGSRDENSEADFATASSSGSNVHQQRPEATNNGDVAHFDIGGLASRMTTEEDSALDNIDIADTTFPSRNPYRDSMNDGDNQSNMETLPATYYTGDGKGKGRAFD
ncbi:uncharacterized protein Bfra_000868 [Botrytis fragariae]|uniref:Uncharacterized protein n=1 Tax=Botrytis fragariae TaxID=1964551 RepID=A0A8H6ENB8_9HELO|nr:uncharacterized protein Bfra_000868 [Botrytis fragariae]KAF5878701.1 hypothetical protein Bfra_000868 [Botrytis fragariae]